MEANTVEPCTRVDHLKPEIAHQSDDDDDDDRLGLKAATVEEHSMSSQSKPGAHCSCCDTPQTAQDSDSKSTPACSLSDMSYQPSAESNGINSSSLGCVRLKCGKDESKLSPRTDFCNTGLLTLQAQGIQLCSNGVNNDGSDSESSASMKEKNTSIIGPDIILSLNANLSDNALLPYSQASIKPEFSDRCLTNRSNLKNQTIHDAVKEKVKKDPFDLFSDEDTEPKKYQPIKRKLPQTMAPSVEKESHPSFDSVENMLVTKELDCKRSKLAFRVAYVHSEELLRKVNQLKRVEGRAELVYSLIQAFGLLQYLQVVPPRAATESEILGFHSADYIDFLRDASTVGDVEEEETTESSKLCTEAETYGLSYDCPLQYGIYETASLISGGSITAADTLVSDQANIAINWYGGWHHAKRDSASGFCYINDIVLAILKLREKFEKVLYVDIDLHHGDGVEEAFSLTSKVMTVSFHKYATGFFPGSGALENIGSSRGKFYSVNVPLQDGIKDAEFCSIFFRVMRMVRKQFNPEAVVLQCGADGLSEDQMASFNLTHIGLAKCVCFMLAWNLPTLLLGGGGYNFASTAKCWTFITALVARRKLPLEIPEHENLLAYGPDYQMTTTVGNRRDCNTKQYLANLLTRISHNLQNV